MLALGDTEPLEVTVTPRGPDSLTLVLGAIGPLRARVDAQGTLLGLSGIGGTMQVTVERTQGLDFAAVGKGFAPRSLGVLSPPDSVKASVAGAALAVRYSRPSTRGRAIFGNVVPWNQVWRTGANQATIFETSADLVIAGTPVPAGKYSLWTLPSPAGWKLIVNQNTGQWGTDYNAQYDLARLDMTVEQLRQPVGVTDIEAGAILVFDVPFPHAGAYRFEITIDGERKAAVPLTVSQLPPQTAGGPGGQTLH